jgi:phosphatidylglycerophosphate synthase
MERFNPVYYLLFQSRPAMRLVNYVTFFRIVAFPVFLLLLYFRSFEVFKWLLLVSFLTDALDGYLARKFKVTSILGSRMDSVGDDLTVLAAILGLLVFRIEFIKEHWIVIAILLLLFLSQTAYALIRYQRITSFHTYLAKTAAVFQGFFMCSMFFLDEPIYWLFYATVSITGLEIVEEIVMVALLPTWKSDIRGLYWVLKERRRPPNQVQD